jgi:cell division protein FtsB
MFDFHEKRKIRSLLYSKISVGALLLVALAIGYSALERFSVERDMADRRLNQQLELQELEMRAASLSAKVEELQNERGVEAEIRGRFDVAREGEQVVIILRDEEKNVASSTATNDEGSSRQNDTENSSWFSFLKFW